MREPRRTADGRARRNPWYAGATAALVLLAVLAGGSAPFGGPGGGPAPADPQVVSRAVAEERSLPHSGPADRTLPPPRPERCADGGDPAASLRPSTADGPAVRRVKQRGHLIVGVDQNSYRWSHRDPRTGELEGFDIDLVQAIARDLLGPKPDIVYRTIATDQRIPALRAGRVDLVVRTMTINCERAKQVAFSTAYFVVTQQLLVPHNSPITGYDPSVRGRTLCTAKTSTGESLMATHKLGAEVVTVANQLDCLVRLQLGEVDGVMTDNALAAGLAAQDPSVRLVGGALTEEPYGVAMNLSDEDLVRRVNHVLEGYRSGGATSQWRRSYDLRLGDVMAQEPPAPPEPAYRD
ncbi:glutamate ABC transporter substrate-binding protein [Streptomyces alkaliterrae]|uniref:Glutamate ABC transporter substrate-binding protein n=1 Tax=Streptomyces alkaliterrae TaxID=2213162 RepID=A0A5P0YKY1_9ACTN|nr:glutamate ABC transporter substrate-binding protein [Streptomyces alkaliterrae]MBB1253102.1 glutamate ABC transporter substrate-binding protein [Streptomyces alkaliterrae]MBB1259625.1 glutamate ABC transporter substrate-binding protein [Streptomyces alkaliterrae]MQS00975.1 transporter substrate-binding domain-containing protein [Streptomyces alkaliterrae]